MNWTEPADPKNGVSNYTHVMCDTPIGRFLIEWKGWKERDSYSITLQHKDGYSDSYITDEIDLDSAKDRCHEYLVKRFHELKKYLEL